MRALSDLFRRLLCKVRGHRNRAPFVTVNALYFCECCGTEIYGGTFADLTPMTDEQWEACGHD